MIELLRNLWEMLQAFGLFLDNEINALINLISKLPDILGIVINMSRAVPSIFTVFFGLTLTVSVLFLIVGR